MSEESQDLGPDEKAKKRVKNVVLKFIQGSRPHEAHQPEPEEVHQPEPERDIEEPPPLFRNRPM